MREPSRPVFGLAPVEPLVLLALALVVVVGLTGVVASRFLNTDTGGGRAEAGATSAVLSAVKAADAYYQDTSAGNYSYTGISRARLNAETPGIAVGLRAAADRSGRGYCLEDTQDAGAHWAVFTGGGGGGSSVTYGTAQCSAAYPF